MKEPTCGNCRNYEPYRDIVTGRAQPSKQGKCGWEPEVVWPIAYQWRGQNPLIHPQTQVHKNTPAAKCKQYTPKKP